MPVVLPALPELAALLALVGALIVLVLVTYFAKAFLGTAAGVAGWIPVIGGWLKSSIGDVERKIIGVFDGAAQDVQASIGWSWHFTARIIDDLGREIGSHLGLIAATAQLIPGVGQIEGLAGLIASLGHRTKGTEQAIVGIGNDVLPRVKQIEHGIGNDVLPRIETVTRELDRVIVRDIPGIRAGQRAAEREISNLWRWSRRHTLEAGSVAFAGAVAFALTRVGGGWIRCSNWGRIGRAVCGLPSSLIETLLSDALEAFIVADLCDFVGAMSLVAHELEPLLLGFVEVEGVLIGCHGATAPPPLGLAAAELPPVVAPLTLAA